MTAIASNVADIAWAIQAAKGSPEATSDYRCWMAGGSQPHSEMTKEDFEETTGDRMLQDAYVSQVHALGAPEFFVMPKMIGSLLYGVLGAKSVTGAGDPYTHTFIPAATLPYFTFWRKLSTGIYEKFEDCIITALKIHGESGKPLRVTPTIMGLGPSFLDAAEATASIEKTDRMHHYDGSGALQVEATAVASIRSWDLDIDNGSELIPGDSLTPYDVSVGRLSVMVATTQLVESFSLWNRLHYGSATPTNGDAPTTTPLELAGSPAGLSWLFTRSATRTLELLVPRVQVDPFDDQPDVSGNPLVRTVTYRAYQPASGASITAKVKNAQATY